jgi:hypothetical protein
VVLVRDGREIGPDALGVERRFQCRRLFVKRRRLPGAEENGDFRRRREVRVERAPLCNFLLCQTQLRLQEAA